MKKAQAGFTLVELLIVIVVIAVLAAISIVAYNGIQSRARDTQRLQDTKTVEKSLRIYLAQNGTLFGPTSTDGSWETSAEDTPSLFMETLVSSKTIGRVPVDPINNSSQHYRYYLYGAGEYGCPVAGGSYAVFQIIDFETSSDPSAQSPGFSCSGRDWSPEAEYTFGMYTNY